MLFSLFQYLQDLFFFVAYVNVNSSFPDPLSAKKEEEYLKNIGFNAVTLGSRILRVETVPLFILSVINYEFME